MFQVNRKADLLRFPSENKLILRKAMRRQFLFKRHR